ncbi:hypothetical protein BDQ12DRAFT_666141 [Crucibulum laeve]|uniref:MYND-type domain-containing protein n=1 Tax=Crucibulum laeve TaxID=68775 RepID=A0A5C3LYV2_9AGAR|nr:hypothetical protein BDQ12DRAFT_666141 [Crucibulum laeve]
MQYTINLHDRSHFPAFLDLPGEYSIDEDYYEVEGGFLRPRKHWCFLAEISEYVPWPVRPMYNVKDANGQVLLVAFHLEDRSLFPKIISDFKIGYTIAFMNEEGHRFMDGQIGVRVEKISDSLNGVNPSTMCPVCDNPAGLRCSRCTLNYCGKECQLKDWKQGHKLDCVTRQQIIEWGKFDWNVYDRVRSF